MSEKKIIKKPKIVVKKQTTVNVDTSIINGFKGNAIGLSQFINVFAPKYLDGEL